MATAQGTGKELHLRSWEAIDSLLRTLGSTLELGEVVQRSLLTVSGQLLMSRAALYLLKEDQSLELYGCLGIRMERLGDPCIPLEKSLLQHIEYQFEFQNIFSTDGLPDPMSEQFEFVAPVSDGERILALLLLGGRIGAAGFGAQDTRLLHTLGTVLGTSIQRSLAYEGIVEAKERAERVQQLQQQIIDHVSHEFNTPLMILKSSIDFYGTADEEQREELRAMYEQAVERLEGLISSILEVGAVTTSPSQLIPFGHADLIELCIMPALDASPWPQERVRIENQIEEHAIVLADALVLQRALHALLDNAWRFAGESGSDLALVSYLAEGRRRRSEDLQPRLENLCPRLKEGTATDESSLLPETPESTEELDTLVIEIVDAGIGIPEHERFTVFEPFAQATNSPSRHVSGTGMGLALARRRVEAMRGEIVLASQEKLGSLFVILLPLETDPQS